MKVETLLNELRKLGVQLQLVDDQLKVNAPAGKLTPDYIGQIKENRTAIVTYLKQLRSESYQPIPRVPDRDSYVLSNAQKRLWLLSQLGEQSVAYNIPSLYKLEGDLDATALGTAFRILSERHESLRTVFLQTEEEPGQRILPAAGAAIEMLVHDFSKSENPAGEAYAYAMELLKRPFDLEAGPLVAVELLKTGAQEYLFICSIHHIISDEWSVEVMVREINTIYNALVAGEKVSLSPLSIQYRDYTAWQQRELKSARLQADRAYWLSRFSGELPLLELPADYRRPPMHQHHGAMLRWQFPAAVSEEFRQLLQQQQATLFMGVMALVNVLLYRYTGQTDIILGSPVAGRDHPDLEDQIGFYVNTLAFRNQINAGDTFLKVLAAVRDNTMEGFSHQAYPFDLLVDELDIKRDLSRSPLFDVMVVWQNVPHSEASGISLAGIRAERLHLQDIVSKFDLTLFFEKNTEGLQVLFEYNSDIYSAARMEQMARHLQGLMEAVVSHSAKPVATLNYLSAGERGLLETFNETAVEWPVPAKDLVSCFERRVEMYAEQTALITQENVLSYKELNARANQLAYRLRTVYGVSGNELIGISTDRNEYLLIGILGILKAGAAYVPIDPEYPVDRIRYIVENSGLKLVLTDSEITDAEEDVELVYIPGELQEAWEASAEASVTPKENDIAYVIYTSGSTGKPKGVLIRHSSAVNVLRSVADKLQLTPADRWVAITTYTFDMSVVEMFAPLLSGGCVILAGKQEINNPDALATLLEDHAATVLQATPGMWNLLTESGWKGRKELQVISGGEAMSETLIRRLLALTGRVWNMYGPTETTVYSTALELTSVSQVNLIGRPVANTQVYILDQKLQLQPVGVPGELCIGGDGVAAGYLNNEVLTADRFIANPYGEGLLYRTGDIARWHYTGDIEYQGRRDNQVKIRGYRIELGEIESALISSGLVSQAVVITVGEGAERALSAYYTIEKEAPVAQIRSYLQSRLPHYMVPAYFTELPELPLTSNGKIDRKSLPQPNQQTRRYRAPETGTEQMLAGIWAGVLGCEQVGLDDNFFEIGGNSLKAMQVISKIFREHSVKLDLRDLFANAVLSAFVEKVEIMMWINGPVTTDLSSNTDEIIL